MLLGFVPDLAVGTAAIALGRVYRKPWLSILGGVYTLATLAMTGLQVAAVIAAAPKSVPFNPIDPSSRL